MLNTWTIVTLYVNYISIQKGKKVHLIHFISVHLIKKFCFAFESLYISFPGSSAGKESASNGGDPDWIPGLGRSLG